MSSKIVQPDFFPELKPCFEEVVRDSFKALFARDSARHKGQELIINRMLELEEIVFRMQNRIDHISQNL